MRWHRRSVFPWIRHTGSSLLQLAANPHGGLTLADAPLIDAEIPFRQPGPAQSDHATICVRRHHRVRFHGYRVVRRPDRGEGGVDRGDAATARCIRGYQMIRAAIAGLGRWGRSLVQASLGHERLTIVRAAEPDLNAAKDFCAQHHLELTSNLDAVLADASIDAVLLATPHSLDRKSTRLNSSHT